jgi:5-methylcytosine-specific restriction endonuclease McrA
LLPLKRRIDHKIPLSKGGSNHISNLWLVCEDCDKDKKNKLFKRFKKDTDIKLKKVVINNLTKKI